MSKRVYFGGLTLGLLAGVFLLTNWLVRPPSSPPLGQDLRARCEKMRLMQIRVYHGTKALAAVIDANSDKKPSQANIQDALDLCDQEARIIEEASRAIAMLQTEGSAVAFTEVFDQVRDDMRQVMLRLERTDLGKATLALEADILDTLEEMVKPGRPPRQDSGHEP